MAKYELKPCICGAEPPKIGTIKSKIDSTGGRWYVGCVECGCTGAHGRTEKEAAQNWNDGWIYLKGAEE